MSREEQGETNKMEMDRDAQTEELDVDQDDSSAEEDVGQQPTQDSQVQDCCPDEDGEESEQEEDVEQANNTNPEKKIVCASSDQHTQSPTEMASSEEEEGVEDEPEPVQKKLKQQHDEIGLLPTPLRCEMAARKLEPETKVHCVTPIKKHESLPASDNNLRPEQCRRKLKQENSYPEDESRMCKKKGKSEGAQSLETDATNAQPSLRKSQRLVNHRKQTIGEESGQETLK